MHGSLQLLKYVVMHFVAARAEFFRVGELECGVEGTPEKDSANETAQREKSQAQISAGPANDAPEPNRKIPHAIDHVPHCFAFPISTMSSNVLSTSGFASVCGT